MTLENVSLERQILENVSLESQILENVSLAIPNEMMPKNLSLEWQILQWQTAHFIGTGVNFGECDVLTTHSRESDVLTTRSLTSHFIGETSVLGLS